MTLHKSRRARRIAILDSLTLVSFAALVPLVGYGVWNVRSDTASVARWLPSETPERVEYDRFVRLFGVDDFLLASWQGCTVEDARLDQLAQIVRGSLATGRDGRPPLVSRAVTTREALKRLQGEPLQLRASEARRRLAGYLLGRDEQTAALLIEASAEGARQQTLLMQEIYSAAKQAGIPREELYLGGSIFEAVAIDRESLSSLTNYVIPSAIAVVALALAAVGDVKLVMIMLAVSVFCQGLSVALLYYTGGSLDAVLIIMPTLVYVTTMSSTLHLINYYRQAVGMGAPHPATWAFYHGWRPCAGASLTTAAGLVSLTLSKVEPVRMFGFYSALSVALALAVTLLVVPPALRQIQNYRRTLPRWSGLAMVRNAPGFGRWLDRRRNVVCVILLTLVAGVGWGVGRLESSLNLQQMFPPDSLLAKNYRWLEANVGPLISIEVLASFPGDGRVDPLRQLEVLEALERVVRKLPEVECTMSALTYTPPMSRSGAFGAVAQRALLRRFLRDDRSQLAAERVVAADDGRDVWRISARVSAMAGLEYGDFTAQVEQTVRASLGDLPTEVTENLQLQFTGLTPVVYRAQSQILDDLFSSFLGAFALITPMMMLHLRSIVGGLVAMIPNVSPVLVVFGALGWLAIPVNIGVVLTASVGMGIAVDGTLHFVGWHRNQCHQGATRLEAVISSLTACAPALIQATLIVGLGLLVYALSDFLPTARFTWLFLALLLCALAADLVLMPALLLTPLGRSCEPPSSRNGTP